MQVVYFGSTPRTDKTIKGYIDIFLNHGWLLIKTEPALVDERNTKYTLGWPEGKGEAIIPKGFSKVKVLEA